MSDDPVFVAGASGVIGRRLCQLLVADGYTVFGTTRAPERAKALEALGVEPVIVNVFDLPALRASIAATRSRLVIHQLTDLPPGMDPARLPEARVRNARLRDVGTRNLVDAAAAAGVGRMVAQSIAFAYAPGSEPYDETAPLDLGAGDEAAALNARGVEQLERAVLGAPFIGIVLRYGKLYGPGTGFDRPAPHAPLHVDAAAYAARLALVVGERGVYNVAEDDGAVRIDKARKYLGWDPAFRLSDG